MATPLNWLYGEKNKVASDDMFLPQTYVGYNNLGKFQSFYLGDKRAL